MTSKLEKIQTAEGLALLKRSERKTLAISVLPNGELELIAPIDSSDEDILAKVEKRSRWIRKQRRSFAEMNVDQVPKRYVNGATHRYLGKQYRLKIEIAESCSVRLKGAYFHVATKTGKADEVEALLETWFRERARVQFRERLEKWNEWCVGRQLPTPRLSTRRMLKRWGSAGVDGRIALNPELIHAPSVCIDYVIAHEICHLRHPNHSRAFFQMLDAVMPDWRRRKERLEHAET